MLLPNDDVINLRDLGKEDIREVGEELSLMGELAFNNVKFAPSFVVTPQAFSNFKSESNLHVKIKHLLGSMNSNRKDSVMQISSFIKSHIKKSAFPNSFVKKVFDEYENIEKKSKKVNLTLTAFYLHKGIVFKKGKIKNVTGEASLISHIRELWTFIFEQKLLSLNELTSENHFGYGVVILVTQELNPNISGYIRTIGDKNEKHQHIIEASEHVKLVYNKNTKKIDEGIHLSNKWHDLLPLRDIKTLIQIAKIADEKLYYPYFLKWELDKNISVTEITPITYKTDYYSKLESLKGVPLHPGVRIGRVRLFEDKNNKSVTHDEIIILKTLTKRILDSIKTAAAIITEDPLNDELKFYISQRGIPTITHAKDAFKSFNNGEIVSVDATSGQISHGSILIH